MGKISAGIRCKARMEQRASATTATRIVTGRRRADRTSHIESEFQCSPFVLDKINHMVRSAACCMLLCISGMAQIPPPVKVPDSVGLDANLPYDQYPDTRLDILYPKAPAAGLRPGVIMFHGGGWIRSTKETMMTAFCLPFLEQGFVVANVEYRMATADLERIEGEIKTR